MFKKLWFRTLTILSILRVSAVVAGCRAYNDIEDNDSIADPPPDASNQIPTVTIEELQIDKAQPAAQISWRLNAFPAPKTDLAVKGSFRSKQWVVIPKSSNHSEEFKATVITPDNRLSTPLPMPKR